MPKDTMPDFSLPDAQKAQLIYVAQDSGFDLPTAVNLLFDYYRSLKAGGRELKDLEVIFRLRDEIKRAELEVSEVRRFLEALRVLEGRGYDMATIMEVKVLSDDLTAQGLTPDDVRRVKEARERLEGLGISLERLEGAVATHERLKELGFDKEMATTLMAEIKEAGDKGVSKVDFIKALGDKAIWGAKVEALLGKVGALERQRRALEERIAKEEEWEEGLLNSIEELKKERDELSQDINLAKLLFTLLAGRPDDQFWSFLDTLWRIKRGEYGRGDENYYSQKVKERVVEILRLVVEEELVPRWELEAWKREKAEELKNELREKLEELEASLGELLNRATTARWDVAFWKPK